MRLLATLIAVFVPVSFALADRSPEEKKEAERLEKAGAQVTVDNSLPDAACLRVTFTNLDDKAAANLKGCKHIGGVIVEDASKITDRTLPLIGALSQLRELNLYKCGMTNAGMANLKGLKELRKLYLIDAKVNDSGVTHLKGLEKLEELDLSGTGITGAAGATFKTLPALNLLAVSKTKFGDTVAVYLKELTSLKKLEAVNTDLSVKGAVALEAAIPKIKIRR